MLIYRMFLLLGIIPFIFSWPYLPFVSWSLEAVTVMYAVIVAAVVFYKTREQDFIELNPLGLTAFVFIGFVGINSIANDQAYLRVPMVVSIYMFIVTLMAIAVRRAQNQSVDVTDALAKGFFYCSWIQIVFSFLQFFGLVAQYSAWMGYQYLWIPRYPLIDYATGLFFQANHLVDFMFISLAATIYLFTKKQISKYVLGLWVILAGCVSTFSGSRSSFLYVFIFVVLGILILWRNKNSLSRRTAKVMMISAIGLMLVQLSAKFILPLFKLTMRQGVDRLVQENLFGMRFRFWEKGLLMFKENPWFGVGWGNFGEQGMALQNRWPFDRQFTTSDFFHHSHNFFIQLLAENGIIGTLPILIGIYFVIRSFIRGKWDEKRIFVAASAAIVFCHSQLEYPLWYAYFIIPISTLISTQDTKWIRISFPKKAFNAISAISITTILIGTLLTIKWHSSLVPIINSSMAEPLTSQEKEDVAVISNMPFMAEMSDFARLSRLYDLSDKDLAEKLRVSELLEKTRPNSFVLFRRAVYLSYDGQYTRALECIDKAYLNSGLVNDMIRFYNEIKTPDPRLNPLRQKLEALQKQDAKQ